MAGRAALLRRRATVFRRPNLRFIATVVLGTFVITYASSASTLFMPDADSATLVAILSNAIKTVSALNEQLGELRKVYTATKRLAAYADDSRQAFDALARLDFARLEAMVERSVPNAGYFGREARYGYKSWGHGSGELEMLMSLCLNDREGAWKVAAETENKRPKTDPNSVMTAAQAADVEKWRRERPALRPRIVEDPCETLQRRLSGQEVSIALERLFGSPASAPGTQQAAESRLSADAQQVRNTARAESARALLRMCQDVTESDFDTCQAAAMSAEVGSYQQLVELTDQVADLNRTEATRLLQETADRERLRREAQNRGQILQQGIEDLPTQTPKVEAPGFSFTEQQ